VGKLGGAVLLALSLPLLLGLLGTLILVLLEWVLADGLVGLKVEILEVTGIDLIVDVLGELGLEALLVVVGKALHVLSNVTAGDILAEGLGVELLGLDVETGEAVLGVGDEKTTVRSTLQGTEDTGTSGGTDETDIKENLEGAAGAVVGFGSLGQGVFTVSLLDTLEGLVELELLEETASEKQTGGVGSRPVGQTVVNAIALQFVGVGRGDDLVTGDFRVDDLGDDITVGEADLAGKSDEISYMDLTCDGSKLTTRRCFLAEYLFLAWVIRRLRA
jgi:hypothetical protein